jgi:hypothetical protein
MLTAPTPLFSAPTRSSAILVEPRINPVETGASSSGGTPIRIRAGKRRCDSAHEAGTELTVAPCCSIHQDDRISPENNRPLRKPWRPPPDRGFLFSAQPRANTTDSDQATLGRCTSRPEIGIRIDAGNGGERLIEPTTNPNFPCRPRAVSAGRPASVTTRWTPKRAAVIIGIDFYARHHFDCL